MSNILVVINKINIILLYEIYFYFKIRMKTDNYYLFVVQFFEIHNFNKILYVNSTFLYFYYPDIPDVRLKLCWFVTVV